MDKTPYKDSYILQLEKLSSIVEDTNSRIISDPPDSLIYDNANFFTKAFLITMCAYLESYLKDSLMTIVDDTNIKLVSAKLPHNLILWSLGAKKDIKETDLFFIL